LRPGPLTTPTAAVKLALRELARRAQTLGAEIELLDAELARLAATAAPGLLARRGVGAEVASALLVVAGDNPQRLRSEAAFAMLCGASPLPASSGRTVRHRLNRGGDRQANNALWRIVLVRMSCDARTRSYVARRTAEGKSKREIIRCLKRYIAREVYQELRAVFGDGTPLWAGQATQRDSSGSTQARGRSTDAVTTALLPALNGGLPRHLPGAPANQRPGR
jgi:transposase